MTESVSELESESESESVSESEPESESESDSVSESESEEATTMAESSNLISEAREFVTTKTAKEISIAIGPLFTDQETSEYKAAVALYESCASNFLDLLFPKLLTVYRDTSDGVLRFRLIYLLTETIPELRNSNFHLSPLALRETKPLVISCLKMNETKESDIKILSRIVSFVASNVDDGGWDELSDCLLKFANCYPFRAFLVFLDLPLVYKRFINEDVRQRILDRAKNVLLSSEKGRVEDWCLALETVFKIGVLDSQTDVESIVLESANVVVKKGMKEFLEKGLEDLKKFLARDGNLCKYSKDQRVFVGRLAFNIAACYQTIEDSKRVASEFLRVVRKPKKYRDDDDGLGFDIYWSNHLKNLTSLEVLRIFVRTDLGELSRELAIRHLNVLLSDHTSTFVVSHHISVMRQIQPLLISCLEEDGLSDRMFKVLGEVVDHVNSEMLLYKNESWDGLRDYILSKSQTEFQRAVYVVRCLTMPLDDDKFVIPVMDNLLPEISPRLDPPRELLIDNSCWVLAFTGAFCAIIHLIDIETRAQSVKEIALKMIGSVRELVERGMEVGHVRRAFRDVESIVKKHLEWYSTSEYKFVKGLLWRLYGIKGMKMESKMVLWRINVIVERRVTDEDKELPESELDWIKSSQKVSLIG